MRTDGVRFGRGGDAGARADGGALRRVPSPPTACSLVPREAVDPSPNFGGGVRGHGLVRFGRLIPACSSPPLREERAGRGPGGGATARGGRSCAPAGALSPDRLFARSSRGGRPLPQLRGRGCRFRGCGALRRSRRRYRLRWAGGGVGCTLPRLEACAWAGEVLRASRGDGGTSAAAGQALRKSHLRGDGASPLSRAVCGRGAGGEGFARSATP
jgi:hypothetical protein